MNITSCRYCMSSLTPVLDLGRIPLVNYFPTKEEVQTQKTYPLRLVSCDSCGLLQLDEIIPASEIFSTYHYVTGASKPLIQELSVLANSLIQSRQLTEKSRVLDIGCNDGTLLSFFHEQGIRTIGVEPSHELSEVSSGRGIETINTFFTTDVAKKIVKTYGYCDVVSATHVLANIIDLGDCMEAIRTVLSPTGVCIIEVADAEVMLATGQFDSIYHEHYSYFTSEVLVRIAADHHLAVSSVTKSSVQGGAIRVELVHASQSKTQHKAIGGKKHDIAGFKARVEAYKKQFAKTLGKYAGKKIVGFGAPAKSVTLTSYMELGGKQISYIVDSTAQKQGRFLPGTNIPIYDQSYIAIDPPDVVIVFSWNYRDVIVDMLKKTLKKGTTIITPFPTLLVETT